MISRRAAAWSAVSLAAGLAGGGYYITIDDPPSFTTWAYGSEGLKHDRDAVALLEGPYKFFAPCSVPAWLLASDPGDVVLSLRANSATNCNYHLKIFDAIALCAFDNKNKWVGDTKTPGCLTLGNGRNYGRALDYCMEGDQVSYQLPRLSNTIHAMNKARAENGLSLLAEPGVRDLLNRSSRSNCYSLGGEYAGQRINHAEAVRLATTIPAESPAPAMPAIYLLLLDP